MSTIHIPKVINNIVEMPHTHVLLFEIPINSEAIVSRVPEVRLGSPKWPPANLHFPPNFLEAAR